MLMLDRAVETDGNSVSLPMLLPLALNRKHATVRIRLDYTLTASDDRSSHSDEEKCPLCSSQTVSVHMDVIYRSFCSFPLTK